MNGKVFVVRGLTRSLSWLIFLAGAVLFLAHGGSCGEQGLTPQLTDQCLCPGQQLQLLCTAVGLGTTVWSGTAFPSGCASLLLPHNRFSNSGGETRSCPPDITAASVSVDGDCYTSRLNVTIRSNLNEKDITCVHDNGTVPFLIDTYNITVITESFPPPNNVNLTSVGAGTLTFDWTEVAPNCSAVSYDILSSGCGHCPVSTGSTSVVCSDVILTGNVRSCDFRVQTNTCGGLLSNHSNPLSVSLQAANQPELTVVPTYQQGSSYLISVAIDIQQVAPIAIYGNDVAAQSYNVNYTTQRLSCGSVNLPSQACANGICQTEFNVKTSPCAVGTSNSGDDIIVSVSATSVLGMGPASELEIDITSANFVQVTSNMENGTITCSFQNSQDTSEKMCSVSYGVCGGSDQLRQTVQGNVSSGDPNVIVIPVDFSDAMPYCYTVRASNSTYAVLVAGSTRMTGEVTTEPRTGSEGMATGGISDGAIAAIIIILLAAAAVIIGVFILLVYFIWTGRLRIGRFGPSKNGVGDEEKELDEKSKSPGDDSVLQDTPPTNGHGRQGLDSEAAPANSLGAGEVGSDSRAAEPNESIQSPTATQSTPPPPHQQENEYTKLAPTKSREDDEAAKPDESIQSQQHAEGSRLDVMDELFKKHPGQVPIMLERYKNETELQKMEKQFWISKTVTIAQLGAKIRKQVLKLSNEQTLYLIIDHKVFSGPQTLSELYNSHKYTDGWLYIAYSSQQI